MGFGKSQPNKRLPTGEDILELISEIDIFNYYLGCVPTKPINSPLREDKNPSFNLFHSDKYGKILYKDFATGEVGDCFVLVKRLFNLATKNDAFNKVAEDFYLTQFRTNSGSISPSTTEKKVPERKKVKFKKNQRLRISVRIRPWKIRDKEFWMDKYGLNKTQLEYCGVYPISHYFINGYCTEAKNRSYAFLEEKDGIQTFKIYQPYADKEEKWINNNDYSTWELWTQMPQKGHTLIITSSRKDAMVIKSLFNSQKITSCSLQSEGVNPKESVVNELKGRFKHIYVLYDNDFNSKINRGRIAGKKLCDQTGFSQIEIPDGCYVKDPSDYVDEYDGESLRRLIIGLIRQKQRNNILKTKTNDNKNDQY